jgi:ribosome-associated protein
MNIITINKDIKIPYSELKFDFFRSSGAGGQHVNKVETGVRLRYNVTHSIYLPEHIKKRLRLIHSGKINREGDLLIESTVYKSQHQNRKEVIDKLTKLLIQATKKEKKRIKTARTISSIKKRLYNKKKRSNIKRLRSKPDLDDS